MYRTLQQNSQLHALVTKLNIDPELKEEMVVKYTQGRTNSSAKMLITECQALINHLKSLSGQGEGKQPGKGSSENIQRRKILSICHEMNWKINGQLDWEKINAWLLKFGYLHKPLNDYALAELPKLVTQFENLLKTFYAKR